MKISIVIPTYPPHFCLLETCISYIMKSTILPDEIIISASEITDLIAANLLLELQKNCNVPIIITGISTVGYAGTNRNAGVLKCNNDIIIFMDADDYMHYQKIEIDKTCFELYPDCKQLLNNSSTNIRDLDNNYDIKNLQFFKYMGDFNKTSIVTNGMDTIHRGNIAIHKNTFNKIKYSNVMHREDNIFTKKVHKIFNQSYFIPLKLFIYNESGIEFKNKYYNAT